MHEKSTSGAVHLSGYQRRDEEVVDYEMYHLDDTGLQFRGPRPDALPPKGYIACIGAAQTFGCFCDEPYPALLARQFGMPVLNLGYGGAGPEFFVNQSVIKPYLDQAALVIVQVMSGRSQSNPYYDCGGLELVTRKEDGVQMGANEAFDALIAGNAWLRKVPVIGRRLARYAGRGQVQSVVAGAREAWIENAKRLASSIEAPTILFWFSKRTPEYTPHYHSATALFGAYPQLVDRAMIDRIKGDHQAYVECVTARGSPQKLFHKDTGEPVIVHTSRDRPDLKGAPWAENKYYPSPQMHEDAAAMLEPYCRTLLDSADS